MPIGPYGIRERLYYIDVIKSALSYRADFSKFYIDKPGLFSYTSMYTTLYIGIKKRETLYFVFSGCLMDGSLSMEGGQ